mgnify:CR=1 FL=1
MILSLFLESKTPLNTAILCPEKACKGTIKVVRISILYLYRFVSEIKRNNHILNPIHYEN